MNEPSRNMPEARAPGKPDVWLWLFLATLLGCLVWGFCTSANVRWLTAGLIVWIGLAAFCLRRHFGRVKAERNEESIRTFARALPARNHDTRVVRAVYEELTARVRGPIRPSDDLHQDLAIDPDDLDKILHEIARRTNRSIDDTKQNPMFGRVTTVADLVAFCEHQPRR